MHHHGWLWLSRTKRILLNETGQMTVFVALIFQVLFVFFAMVINIGLIVHDKINLQNAVDLAAYYGAERQAEILNEIAHVNYQIRQDYKLLTWRYRVLGTLGRGGPNNTVPPAMNQTTAFGFDDHVTEEASVCVANEHWYEALQDSPNEENYCYKPYGQQSIQRIITLPVIAPFVPGVTEAALATAALRSTQNLTFLSSGQWNWAFAAQIMEAYKFSIANRKAIINQLRKNLVDPNFVDQKSELVKEGVLQTIKKNLTLSNSASLEDDSYHFINGLADQNCAQGDGAKTIVDIKTAPTLWYTWPSGDDVSLGISQAEIDAPNLPFTTTPQVDVNTLSMFVHETDSSDPNSQDALMASTLGFEKNPWCMAYVGVSIKSHPRKPFAPFGKPVTLEARAFAQPFGGRIGPWYMSNWAASSDMSSGGRRIDPLTSDRFTPGQNMVQRLPNYSRFPDDQWGLKGKASQAAERKLLIGYHRNGGQLLSYEFFSDFGDIPKTGDPLAYDTANQAYKNVRVAEAIAVSPDAFDITYYSIDSHYGQNYKALNANGNRFQNLPTVFGTQVKVAPDIGGRNDGDASLQKFSVFDQIRVSQPGPQGIDSALVSSLPFLVFNANQLLTGWAPNTAQDYSFPAQRFAQCSGLASNQMMIPGGCAQGGRTGYSVRLIARGHLLSKKWAIGGDGESPGPIRNPPPDDF